MRPIDANWAIRELLIERDKYPVLPGSFQRDAIRGGIRKGLRVIESAPTLDAVVPVIRCKDCAHFKFGDYCTHPIIEHAMCRKSDYCSHAVRKNVCQSE